MNPIMCIKVIYVFVLLYGFTMANNQDSITTPKTIIDIKMIPSQFPKGDRQPKQIKALIADAEQIAKKYNPVIRKLKEGKLSKQSLNAIDLPKIQLGLRNDIKSFRSKLVQTRTTFNDKSNTSIMELLLQFFHKIVTLPGEINALLWGDWTPPNINIVTSPTKRMKTTTDSGSISSSGPDSGPEGDADYSPNSHETGEIDDIDETD